jgi:hypothetical protein
MAETFTRLVLYNNHFSKPARLPLMLSNHHLKHKAYVPVLTSNFDRFVICGVMSSFICKLALTMQMGG